MAESIIDNIKSCQNKRVIITNPVEHISHCFKHPFPKIKWSYISTCEIEKKNTKSLKTKFLWIQRNPCLNFKIECTLYYIFFNLCM